MIIGLDFFGVGNGMIFDTRGGHGDYYELSAYGGLLDHLHVDKDLNTTKTTDKTDYFTYDTVLNADFKNSLEGGSVSNEGREIEKIRFQKRRKDELYWTDVAELKYSYPEKTLYETLDKYVQNDEEYEYSLLPVTNEILGNRVVSSSIQVSFDGYFISDNDNNFIMLLNAELGDIEHISKNSVTETLNGRFPIVSYANIDYRQGSLKAMMLSASFVNTGTLKIGYERNQRENLLKFLKNKKPKILRGMGGELMLIGVVGSPNESPHRSVVGASNVGFDYVEIDVISSDTLRENGLIEGLSDI